VVYHGIKKAGTIQNLVPLFGDVTEFGVYITHGGPDVDDDRDGRKFDHNKATFIGYRDVDDMPRLGPFGKLTCDTHMFGILWLGF